MSDNPLKTLIESRKFKELPLWKQKQQYYKLRSKLGRRVEPKKITSK